MITQEPSDPTVGDYLHDIGQHRNTCRAGMVQQPGEQVAVREPPVNASRQLGSAIGAAA